MKKTFLMCVYFGKNELGNITCSKEISLHGDSVRSLKQDAKSLIEKLALCDYKITLAGFRNSRLVHRFSNLD